MVKNYLKIGFRNLLKHKKIQLDRGGFVRFEEEEEDEDVRDFFVRIGCCLSALGGKAG